MCKLTKILNITLAFLLAVFKLWAWNEDYNPENLSGTRTVCAKNLSLISNGSVVKVRSIPPDEPCATDEKRYSLVMGKEPKGSLAFLPLTSLENVYPPWKVSWPVENHSDHPRLWHFTCLATSQKEILKTSTQERHFRGEITTSAREQSCQSALTMAQSVCMEQWGGNEIFEQCE
jgi:hypothetical protein